MEDEFELSLELSIGGCYSKSEGKSLEREKGEGKISRSEAKIDAAAAEDGGEFSDMRRRREMQAMKRREARMKRELKKSRGVNGSSGFVEVVDGVEVAAEEEPARKREKSSFGENKVAWVDYGRQQQFLLPVGNGFACPWVVPLPVAGERDERNSGEDPPGYAAASSSAVTHRRSTSQKGGSSSDTGSHSSSFGIPQIDRVEQLEVNNSSSRTEPSCQYIATTSQEHSIKVAVAGADDAISDTSKTVKGSAVTTSTPTSSVVSAPPPNPHQDGGASPLHMPCVSTTGNGRTITGVLYKYTKSEVSIMCVCHGSFFSPAEFVEHAGGIDVTHPLRQITVVPSAVR